MAKDGMYAKTENQMVKLKKQLIMDRLKKIQALERRWTNIWKIWVRSLTRLLKDESVEHMKNLFRSFKMIFVSILLTK